MSASNFLFLIRLSAQLLSRLMGSISVADFCYCICYKGLARKESSWNVTYLTIGCWHAFKWDIVLFQKNFIFLI